MGNSHEHFPHVRAPRRASLVWSPTERGTRRLAAMTRACRAVRRVLTGGSARDSEQWRVLPRKGMFSSWLALRAHERDVGGREQGKYFLRALRLLPSTSYTFCASCLRGAWPSRRALHLVLLELGCPQDCFLRPAGWRRKLISDCADVQTALINDLKWLLVANNRSS